MESENFIQTAASIGPKLGISLLDGVNCKDLTSSRVFDLLSSKKNERWGPRLIPSEDLLTDNGAALNCLEQIKNNTRIVRKFFTTNLILKK